MSQVSQDAADKTIQTAPATAIHKHCCEGSWIECINPFSNPVVHGYFRHIPGCRCFDKNDVAKICPLCWRLAQEKNGTLVQAPRPSSENSWRDHLTKSKPEKDTL